MIVFWSITGLALLLMVAFLIRTTRTDRAMSRTATNYDLNVYRDQLKEIDRDVARGVLSETDAERVRIEVSRRILAADVAAEDAAAPFQDRSGPYALAGIAVAIVAGSYALYINLGAPGYGDLPLADRIEIAENMRAERPGQEQAEAGLPPVSVGEESPEYVSLVEQLRVALETRPDDARGFRLLAQSEARLGNFAASYKAQAKVLELTGGPEAEIQDWTDYADLLILAAGGYVSPEAERVLTLVLERDQTNPTARYYWGVMLRQTGRPDRAFRIWDRLLRESPADAPWVQPIMLQIDQVAAAAGVIGYQPPTPSDTRGPSQADIEAAQEMSPAERMAMIEGMVGGLASRLAEEGGPPQDWARLISALGVLNRLEEARSIFQNAKEVFGEEPGAMDIINRAADRAGLI